MAGEASGALAIGKVARADPVGWVDLPWGELFVYYRFGGRMVAVCGSTSGVRYLLGDHLSSTHGEVGVDQSDLAQRRYTPFGSDRAVSGASDLSRDERFTGQPRVNAGGGNARRELYYYGARWYLPGVGIFTQPDSIVPDPKNPQALNRFSYALNNPMRYKDPTGHEAREDQQDDQYYFFIGGFGTTREQNLEIWLPLIIKLGLKLDQCGFFQWEKNYNGIPILPASVTRSTDDAAKELAAQIYGHNNVTLVGHSKGGALIMEYLAEVAEGKIGANPEVMRAFTVDAPLAGDGWSEGAMFHRYGGLTQYDRLDNLQARLNERGMHTQITSMDNLFDPIGGRSSKFIDSRRYAPVTLGDPRWGWNPFAAEHGRAMKSDPFAALIVAPYGGGAGGAD